MSVWPVDRLVELNAAYHVAELAPGLVVLGSDGGGEAYAFAEVDIAVRFVQLPFIGMGSEAPIVVADGFGEFLERVAETSA